MNKYILLESKVSKYFKNILKEDYLKEGVFEYVTIVPKMISIYFEVRNEALKRCPDKEKIFQQDKRMKELIIRFKKIKNDKGIKKEGFIYIQESYQDGLKELIAGFLRELGLIVMSLLGASMFLAGTYMYSILGDMLLGIGAALMGVAALLSFINFWYSAYRIIVGLLDKTKEADEYEKDPEKMGLVSKGFTKIRDMASNWVDQFFKADPDEVRKLKNRLKKVKGDGVEVWRTRNRNKEIK